MPNTDTPTSVYSFKSFCILNGKLELLFEVMITDVRRQVDTIEAGGDEKRQDELGHSRSGPRLADHEPNSPSV